MAQRVRTSPRKAPQQARSKATVDAILDGTIRVLVRDGYDRTSTNRVAEQAGVSIGSLYQYFPSKEALVAAVVQRHVERICLQFTARMAEVADRPLPEVIRELVRTLIEVKRVDPKLHRVMVEQIPRVGRLNRVSELEARVGLMMRAFFEAHRQELRPRNLDAAIFMLVSLGVSYSHALALDAPPGLTQEALTEEFVALVSGYLIAPVRPGRGARNELVPAPPPAFAAPAPPAGARER